jgi:hypothetical protein
MLVIIARSGAGPVARRLRGREALIALEEVSYGLSSLHASGGAAEHFYRASEIAARLPVIRLSLPRDLSLNETMEHVMEAARMR